MARRTIVRVRRGGLHGWDHTQAASTRHRHLRTAVREDGYATVVERLGALRRFDHRRYPGVARVAAEDQRWLHATYRGGDDGDRGRRE